MEPGTLGMWDGERWTVADEEIQRRIDSRLLDSCRPNTLLTDWIDRRANGPLIAALAAAIADPNLGDESVIEFEENIPPDGPNLAPALRAASRALAGYLLERLTETKAETA